MARVLGKKSFEDRIGVLRFKAKAREVARFVMVLNHLLVCLKYAYWRDSTKKRPVKF